MAATDLPAFTSTGPQGHRSRMRARLLARPEALADYEIVEMLLFLGIARRDTKPQAKALINRFGSLAGALQAPPADLLDSSLPQAVADAFALVCEAAGHMAKARPRDRPRLGDWAALEEYLDPRARAWQPPSLAVLLLDSRNQLLAEHAWPPDLHWPEVQRDLLREALTRHAGALVMVRSGGAAAPVLREEDRARHEALKRAAGTLSILVHDWLVLGAGDWISLRQAGGRA